MKIGERIRQLRHERGWTQPELARRAGIDPSYVSTLERGKHPRPGVETILRLARAFGMSVQQFLEGTDVRFTLPAPHAVGPVVRLAIASAKVAAGPDIWIPTGEYVEVPAERVKGKNVVAVRVEGDCMAPEIQNGDIVIVDLSQKKPKPGDLVVVLTDMTDLLVKRFVLRDNKPLLVDNLGREYHPNGAVVQGVVIGLTRWM